jgi:hypothetical protein
MRRTLAVLAAMALLAGCSSSGQPPGGAPSAPGSPSRSGYVDGIKIPGPYSSPVAPAIPAPAVCPAMFRTIVSQFSPRGSVSLRTQRSAHEITCKYHVAPTAARSCTGAIVIVNTEDLAFFDFNRWTVETGQNSMWGHNPALQPRPVAGIGTLAEWAPAVQTFETATMNTWVAVFMKCPRPNSRVLNLAEGLGRAGLAATA